MRMRTWLLVLPVVMIGCGPSDTPTVAAPEPDALLARLSDDAAGPDERIRRIMAEATPGNVRAVPALLRIIRDRSAAAFVVEADPSARFGLKAVELREMGPDNRGIERVAAVAALDAIGSPEALPDLALALDDRNELVQNYAARALWRLGCRAGVPVLLANLEKRVLTTESADAVLREISHRDMDLEPDAGTVAKQKAVERWRGWWRDVESSGTRIPGEGRDYDLGSNGAADQRLHFFVDVLGQFQFLYHMQARTALVRLGPVALPFLRAGVDRAREAGNETLRAGVAQVCAEIDHPNSHRILEDLLLRDSHASVRLRAALALGSSRNPDSIQLLRQALTDRDPSVTLGALNSLGRVGGPTAVAAIESAPAIDDRAIEEAKLLALFEASGGVTHRDAALELLLSADVASRNAASEVLGRLVGDGVPFDPVAPEKDRAAAVQRFRKQLELIEAQRPGAGR